MTSEQINKKRNIRFAFALNDKYQFEEKHFGDTDKFLVYEVENNKMVQISELTNRFKKLEHGTQSKGDLITNMLKEENVSALVSMQFGENIKIINQHFIPVIIHSSELEETMDILLKHTHWIEDEWNSKSSDYQLFTIRSGIIKGRIK